MAGVYGHIFCNTLQFGQWYRHLMTKTTDIDKMDAFMAEDVKLESTIATDGSFVEAVPLMYSCMSGIYKQRLSARKPIHINVVEEANHF